MPQYSFDGFHDFPDLPGFLDLPLEELARGDTQMSDGEVQERVLTALHEAAHLVVALVFKAAVTVVEVTPKGRPGRTGATGRVKAAELLSRDGALISYAGYAWEQLHGNTACAESDLKSGDDLARETLNWRKRGEAGESREDLLNDALEYVRVGDGAIRMMAAAILAVMPKTGVLEGRGLIKLTGWFNRLFHGAGAQHSPRGASVGGRAVTPAPARRF